jgi:hypothetical protein
MQLRVKKVDIIPDGAVQHYTGDDGYPAAASRDMIWVETVDGKQFVLPPLRWPTAAERQAEEDAAPQAPRTVYWSHQAVEIVAKIEKRGCINDEHWCEFCPDTRSLEERWADDAEIERYERAGYGPVIA